MSRASKKVLLLSLGLPAVGAVSPGSAWGCAACFGQSNSAMAQGMNWGILSLLVMVVLVLGGVASFFIYLARRAAALPQTDPALLAVSAYGEAPAWNASGQESATPILNFARGPGRAVVSLPEARHWPSTRTNRCGSKGAGSARRHD